ncbi:MAG: cadherin-like domain-containing protein, partial [Xanthobacteraceae bacterium]
MPLSLVRDNPLTVRVGATATISAASNLAFSDTDYPASSITYTITTAPTLGTLLKNGSPISSFTQDDLDNNRITYSETAPSASSTSDGFFFHVSDPGGNQTGTTLFPINVRAGQPLAESAPSSLTGFANLATAVAGVQLADAFNDTYTVVVAAGNGTLAASVGSGSSLSISGTKDQVNAALASLSYQGNASGHDTITITASDQADHSSAATSIDVTVRPAGSFTTIADPLGPTPSATGINNAGQIVGNFYDNNWQFDGAGLLYENGFLYSAGTFTTITNMTVPAGGTTPKSILQNINEAGEAVGYRENSSPVIHGLVTNDFGFIYSGGTFQSFSWPNSSNSILPATSSNTGQLFFEGINDSDQIVGYYNTSNNSPGPPPDFAIPKPVYVGFIYQNGTTQQIGPAGTQPFGINNTGQVVGQFGPHGFLYSDGNFSLFDDPYASSTTARDINNNGLIVGFYQNQSLTHGFAYDQSSGTWTTIDIPGAIATFVYGVNDSNQIVGSYTDVNNNVHGFVGTVPPPLAAV